MYRFKQPIYITRPLLPPLDQISQKFHEIWDSQWLSNNGPQHVLFEKKIKEALKVQNVSLFNNGTIALLTAIRSLNLSGEVITTPFTFPATPHCLTWNNITPVFCDIDDKTMNIDTDKIEPLITKKTTAILGVHVFGTPCDVERIQKIADTYKLRIIYDAAHAFGTEINNVGIGNYGDISMFSFHPTKLFHTGEGGTLTFKDRTLKTKIDLMKNFGIKNEEEVVLPGINGKMNEMQAGLGLLVLKLILGERRKRQKLNNYYKKLLKNVPGISFLEDLPYVRNSYQYFVIRINERLFGRSRDYIYEKFKKYNVFTRKYFYPLCSSYLHYKNLPSAKSSHLPIAYSVVSEVLSMPFYGGLSQTDVENICNILISFQK